VAIFIASVLRGVRPAAVGARTLGLSDDACRRLRPRPALPAPLRADHAGNAQAPLPGQIQENTMADDKSKAGGQDRTRINVNEDYELRDWAKKFNVSPDRLKAAVKEVGTAAKDVEKHLGTKPR
jgi:hypothetical protein